MDLYAKILENSKDIDWTNDGISNQTTLWFPVAQNHPRYQWVQKYCLSVKPLDKCYFSEDTLVVADIALEKDIKEYLLTRVEFFESTEDGLKTLSEASKILQVWKNKNYNKIIAIGGGIIINAATYFAEQLNVDLILVPTTIIAMSDASIGGKVRMNDVKEGKYIKHAYKSYWEPSEIILDPRFLNTITDDWVRIGLAEIIKHAMYQSSFLKDFLLSEDFDPFKNKESLLRAILWTADLKRVCLEVDPEELESGSYKILRAAHDLSDILEEKSNLKLPHGKAVEEAMVDDLYKDPIKYRDLITLYNKLSIAYTTVL